MKLVFMGTPDFAVPTLKKLAASRHQVALVVTGPDKPRGRGQKIRPTPVKRAALELGLPIFQPPRLKPPEVAERLSSAGADLFVVVAFRILPESIISIPPRGVINLHASLLPKYRGAAPIQWALLNGDQETGLTTFFIEEGVDTGDIILQKPVPIGDEETAGELHDRLAELGADLVLETIELIAAGKAPRIKQKGEPTAAPKITKEQCRIHWENTARQLVNQIRAFSPVPGAFSYLNGEIVKIYRARTTELAAAGCPGSIMVREGRLYARAGDGWVEILELQPAGRKRLTAAEFLRGRPQKSLTSFAEE